MKKPYWLKRSISNSGKALTTMQVIETHNLHTVCESARCPNRGECYHQGTATFMALGNICTRSCTFCAVDKRVSSILPPDRDEPANIAAAANSLQLDYLVVTMVTRDDLPDGGAGHLAEIVSTVRCNCKKSLMIELLISDLGGDNQSLKTVTDAALDVLNHNMETVFRLYPEVRPQADYRRSLELLTQAKAFSPALLTKSGFMVGLGETEEEVERLMDDLREAGTEILTIGQYLAPSSEHIPVDSYVHPDTFAIYREKALAKGFLECVAGPYVRSSYRAIYAKDLVATRDNSSSSSA